MNQAILIGNLGNDPELSYSRNGDPYTKFNIATNERDGKTNWHRIICFGKTAENCERYLKKGSKVAVLGRIEYGQYEDRDGITRYTTDIIAFNVEFLDTKTDNNNKHIPPTRYKKRFDDESDIPF